MEELIGVALRISVSYLYIMGLMRLSGKRSVGTMAPWDFLVALIIGDMFDDLFWGDVPVSVAIVGFTTVMCLHVATSYITYRFKTAERIIESQPAKVVGRGEVRAEVLARERVSEAELVSQLRSYGLEGPEKVKEAFREPSGQTSVLREEEFKPVTKKDLPRLKEVA